MPQMKPMNWIFLFIMMNLIIMFMNIKNYFFKKYNFKPLLEKNLFNNKNNWKW